MHQIYVRATNNIKGSHKCVTIRCNIYRKRTYSIGDLGIHRKHKWSSACGDGDRLRDVEVASAHQLDATIAQGCVGVGAQGCLLAIDNLLQGRSST